MRIVYCWVLIGFISAGCESGVEFCGRKTTCESCAALWVSDSCNWCPSSGTCQWYDEGGSCGYDTVLNADACAGTPGGGGMPECVPGALRTCSCSATPVIGSQQCDAAGRFGECVCETDFMCGNGRCGDTGENCATCPVDCGSCSGPTCPVAPLGIPFTPPLPLYCGPAGEIPATAMARVNEFWQSGVVACDCVGQSACANNAISLWQYGAVWYDPAVLYSWDVAGGSLLPSNFVLAHEFGHEIQGHAWGTRMPNINLELGADCFGGYFLGYLGCRGEADMASIMGVFLSTCRHNVSLPWWDPRSHGTCEERVAATQRGIDAYFSRADPLVACAL